jgi:hypothetical protein
MSTQPILYVNYDFDTLLAQLQQRLAQKSAWKDMYRSSTGSMLIELFAAVGTLVLYYVERRAEESYISTAQNYSSVVNLARLLNYVPFRNVSSQGTLRFSLSAPATKMVFIPKYTSCTTTGGYKFMVLADGVIMPGQTYVDVSGIQGTKKVMSRISSGGTNQEYNVADTKVENSNVIVTVASVVWTQVTSFINSTNISTNYVLRPELNGTITIVFGNNVFGQAPANGNEILITYIQSDGLAGNVYSNGLITNLESTIYDQDGAVKTVTVTNTTNFLGGDNAETIEDIRTNAPKVFATGDRAVIKSDFKAILNDYPGVADSNAWGEAEEPFPDYSHFNQVKLVVILQNWALPDLAFKNTLSTFLYTKSLMTVRYTYIDPAILQVIPTMDLKVISGNQLSFVQSSVETAISDLFILGDTTKLGISKRLGDIYQAIEGVDGISYSHIALKIYKQLTQTTNTLVPNGGFEVWTAGPALAPDNWILSGTGAAVAREATTIHDGTYSARLTRTGGGGAANDAYLTQPIHPTKGIAYWRGQTVTFRAWVYATVNNRARISIDDGIALVSYSSYHTGNSTWQQLTVTKTISLTATVMNVRVDIDTGSTVAYFDTADLLVVANYAATADVLPLLQESTNFLYLNSTKIAFDNEAGGWTSVGGSGYTTIGTINYATGAFDVSISPAPTVTDTISVRYQQDQNGDIVVGNNQICKYMMTDYTSIGYAS